MTTLWIATANDKKRVELERSLAGLDFEIRTLRDAPASIEIVEDGDTFAANAEIKARTLADAVGGLAFGDDSGLCVTALDGAPGIRSARWAGPDATDADRIAKLLDALAPHADRSAHFTCSLCLADPQGVIARFEDHCHGTIAAGPTGDGGFGYDPVFLPTDQTAESAPPEEGERKGGPAPLGGSPLRSFAQFSPAEKDAISHRGRALRSLVAFLHSTPNLPRP